MKIKLIDYGFKHKLERKHYNDAGADVHVNTEQKITLLGGETFAFPLGFGLKLPDGFMAIVAPRSGHAKQGIICQIPPVDSGYTGEIHAIVTNQSEKPVVIEPQERVGQIVITPIILATFETESLGDERGNGAFNSTGK